MPTWLEDLRSFAFGATGAGGGLLTVRWLATFIGGRMDRRAEALDAGTQRLMERFEARIDELTKRVTTVERELAECQRKHAEAEAKAARLEALVGMTGPAMKLAFPPENTIPKDMAVMAAKLESKA